MIALLSINFGICYLYAPSKRRFIFSPAPSSCSSFWGFSYWKLWDHVASYDSLPTTKVASASEIACMRFVHWVFFATFPSSLLASVLAISFSKSIYSNDREHAHSMSNGSKRVTFEQQHMYMLVWLARAHSHNNVMIS